MGLGELLIVLFLLCIIAMALLVPRIARRIEARLDRKPDGIRLFGPENADAVHSLVSLEIEPGAGIGPVKFGMQPERVVALFGAPADRDTWDDGNVNDSLIFEGMRLSFDSHDSRGPTRSSRLWIIETKQPDAILFGKPLQEWAEHELITRLNSSGSQAKRIEPGYAEFDVPCIRLWFGSDQRLDRVEIA